MLLAYLPGGNMCWHRYRTVMLRWWDPLVKRSKTRSMRSSRTSRLAKLHNSNAIVEVVSWNSTQDLPTVWSQIRSYHSPRDPLLWCYSGYETWWLWINLDKPKLLKVFTARVSNWSRKKAIPHTSFLSFDSYLIHQPSKGTWLLCSNLVRFKWCQVTSRLIWRFNHKATQWSFLT